MGSSRLELPTSRLSGARSNLLSYEPTVQVSLWVAALHASLGIPCDVSTTQLQVPRAWLSGLRTGDDGIRTHDPLLAGQVLSQLSYTPMLDTHLLLSFRNEH